MTVTGALWAAVTLYYSPVFFLWLTPIFAGLLLAIPLVRWTSSDRVAAWVKRRGLLLVPSETEPPSELQVAPWSVEDTRLAEQGLATVPPQEANLAG